jgi:hypothetical protein
VPLAEDAAVADPVQPRRRRGELCTASSSGSSPAGYPASSDITLVVIPEMAHMHNFADTRRQLWDRFLAWFAVLTCLPVAVYPR